MERRLNTCTLIVGRKGTGKSTKAAALVQDYATRNADKLKRALVVDVNGAPAYDGLPFFSIAQLPRWRPDARTRTAKTYDTDHAALFDALQTFKSGLLLFEDCTKYIDPNPSRAIKTFLVDHRMWDVDLVFTFHSLVRVPPFFWEMASHVLLCKTQDARRYLETNQRIPNLPQMLAAYDSLAKAKDPYASKLVRTLI